MPAQELVNASNCLSCIPQGYQLQVLIYIFATIAGVPTDAQTLINNANCLSCIPAGSQMEVLISLADQILAGGGGGGAGDFFITTGTGAPSSDPAGTSRWYVDLSNGATYYSDGVVWTLKS